MSGASLVVEGLTVRHGAVDAVHDLSFEVAPGEIVGLIGPNGAGKSSTLHAVMGLVRPAAGSVRLGGVELAGRRPEDVARSGIALVPEGRRIFAELTVEENLRLGMAARGGEGSEKRALRDVYDLFPVVYEFRRRHAGALSGGQQQQLAIARALVAEPKVLLLDEPSLGLAPIVVDDLYRRLALLRDAGQTLVVVEESPERALRVATRAYILRLGALALEGTNEEVREHPALRAAYLGERAEETP
jgi:branched-chain amino acid transport system ATP-binding protein